MAAPKEDMRPQVGRVFRLALGLPVGPDAALGRRPAIFRTASSLGEIFTEQYIHRRMAAPD